MANNNYKQCRLEKQEEKSTTLTVSWIPLKFAIKGKYLKLKNRKTGEWVNGWKVILVGTMIMDESQVIERSQDYRNQRKASDL